MFLRNACNRRAILSPGQLQRVAACSTRLPFGEGWETLSVATCLLQLQQKGVTMSWHTRLPPWSLAASRSSSWRRRSAFPSDRGVSVGRGGQAIPLRPSTSLRPAGRNQDTQQGGLSSVLVAGDCCPVPPQWGCQRRPRGQVEPPLHRSASRDACVLQHHPTLAVAHVPGLQ